jgi:hypothetical protein
MACCGGRDFPQSEFDEVGRNLLQAVVSCDFTIPQESWGIGRTESAQRAAGATVFPSQAKTKIHTEGQLKVHKPKEHWVFSDISGLLRNDGGTKLVLSSISLLNTFYYNDFASNHVSIRLGSRRALSSLY